MPQAARCVYRIAMIRPVWSHDSARLLTIGIQDLGSRHVSFSAKGGTSVRMEPKDKWEKLVALPV